ncbi:hypothetical protein [Saccharophagus degradans]|uniref:Uncharacterized protein n=1 Tax=Saccharophagus degradans TaxID=86304 RepID=A0AAW7X3F1_9GAMM|nr:hypothetical protein [Saccharophagus degradans]MDO6421141.1 hypothetical protein [Saccharophagus degradans]MDO6605948.1 hypothetical protein [Saccharophagus degradans]
MAGTIAINDKKDFAMSSVYFDAIINYSKKHIENISKELARELYEPIEEAGFYVFGLTETTEKDFKLIFKTLSECYAHCKKEGKIGQLEPQLYGEVMNTWGEVLAAMEEDQRAS